jgi:serine-type D-Ala-D-Ala carboxypeptidase/endopeptidase
MNETALLTDSGVAQGHSGSEPVDRWTGEIFYSAGNRLTSTIDDMLTFVEAHIAPEATPLEEALRLVQQPHTERPGRSRQAMGWTIIGTDIGDLFWKNGGTGGFRSSLVIHRDSKTAVVTLTNTASVDPDAATFALTMALARGRPPAP